MSRAVFFSVAITAVAVFGGCVSVDSDAAAAINALNLGDFAVAEEWSKDLAGSHYSKNLGMVEAGRVQMLKGDFVAADQWFRQGVDTAIDRKETNPKIKFGDIGNTVLASTITDDRTREYYLPPYELNFAVQYGILSELFAGKHNDAMADARLAVYVQDVIAEEYGPNLEKEASAAGAPANGVLADEDARLRELFASTRNSWENPVLWYLAGVLFEADNDLDMAWQSYRKAAAIAPMNAVFLAASSRADKFVLPSKGLARMIVIRERDFVPMRVSVKVPVPIYTAMSIDIPRYDAKQCAVTGDTAIDVLAFAAKDLRERLPGIITRNITRAATQVAAQAVVNNNGNGYAQLGVLLANVVISAVRRADTRSWRTLPAVVELKDDGELTPGDYDYFGRRIHLSENEIWLLWISEFGGHSSSGMVRLK